MNDKYSDDAIATIGRLTEEKQRLERENAELRVAVTKAEAVVLRIADRLGVERTRAFKRPSSDELRGASWAGGLSYVEMAVARLAARAASARGVIR